MSHAIAIKSNDHWHQLRLNNIGSSDAASLFNCNKFQSSYFLWCLKRGLIEANSQGDSRTSWGQRFEHPIAAGLADDFGWHIRKAGYYLHADVTGMGCTPDFIVSASDTLASMGFDGDGVFEIKNLEAWSYFGEFTKEEANHYIEVQIQHQLACTGLQWAALGYKPPGQTPALQYKRRDESFIKLLEQKVFDFWSSTTPPKPDGSDSSTEAVKELYRRLQGKEFIDLSGSNELPYLIGQLEGYKSQKKPLNKQIKEIETEEKAIKNQIMALSQGAEVIKFQGGEIKINTVNRGAVAPCSFQQVGYTLNKEEA